MKTTHEDLLEAGVHFGHQLRRWNPKSKPYIYGEMQGISIIDLGKTHQLLTKAYAFIEQLIGSGENLLFVGTKKQAQEIVREAATSVSMPFCANRWMGGTLTNFATIRRSLEKFKRFLDMETKGEIAKMHKKEASALSREMDRMRRNFEGILDLNGLPGALFVVDTGHEAIAIAEARRLGIPTIALVDTNSDPTIVDYPIPGNDDAVKSVRLIVETITEAVQSGLQIREAQKAQKAVKPMTQESMEMSGVKLSADIQRVMNEPEAEESDTPEAKKESIKSGRARR